MSKQNKTTSASPDKTNASRPVALITGASSGIGRSCALILAKAGYNLALVARTQSTLQATADSCSKLDSECETLVLTADISQRQAGVQLVDQVTKQWGRIDALLNIAGSAPLMPIDQITPEHWQACVDSNLSGAVLLTAAAWPWFKKQQSGFVGNISSMASIDPFEGFSMYAAAKVGLNMFTHCTAQEGSAINVRAVAVAPGAVETPLLRQTFSEEIIASDKTLNPDEVAKVLCDCLLGEHEFTPGQTIVLPSPA